MSIFTSQDSAFETAITTSGEAWSRWHKLSAWMAWSEFLIDQEDGMGYIMSAMSNDTYSTGERCQYSGRMVRWRLRGNWELELFGVDHLDHPRTLTCQMVYETLGVMFRFNAVQLSKDVLSLLRRSQFYNTPPVFADGEKLPQR